MCIPGRESRRVVMYIAVCIVSDRVFDVGGFNYILSLARGANNARERARENPHFRKNICSLTFCWLVLLWRGGGASRAPARVYSRVYRRAGWERTDFSDFSRVDLESYFAGSDYFKDIFGDLIIRSTRKVLCWWMIYLCRRNSALWLKQCVEKKRIVSDVQTNGLYHFALDL